MASTISKAPWQVAFAAASALVTGVAYAASALLQVSYSGDFGAINARSAEYTGMPGLAGASAVEIHEWMALAATVFAVVAAVFVILAILLWQGAVRPGVRVTLTITALVAFVGSFVPLFVESSGGGAVAEEAVIFLLLVHAVTLIGALLLWTRPVKAWVEQPGS